MTNENINDNRLQELGGSDYKIVDGQPNIKGWTVKNQHGEVIGEVDELLFDAESREVRYIVLDLEGNALDSEERDVLVPIGLAEIHESEDEVFLPSVTNVQLGMLPEYEKDSIDLETERSIRTIFGNTASYTNASDSFYDHEHYSDKNLYRRRETVNPTSHSLATKEFQGTTGGTQTVIGVFDNGFEAQNAIGQLKENGFNENQIDVSLRDNRNWADDENDNSISIFFSNIFGDDNNKASYYTDVAKKGSIVTINGLSEESAQRAAQILDQFGAIDIDERYQGFGDAQQSTIAHAMPNENKWRSKIVTTADHQNIRLRSANAVGKQSFTQRFNDADESDVNRDQPGNNW